LSSKALASWAVPWLSYATAAAESVSAEAATTPIMSPRIIGPLPGCFGRRKYLAELLADADYE